MFFKKQETESKKDFSIKICALLIHVAKIDEDYSIDEEEIIKKTLLELDAKKETINQIIKDAKSIEENSNQILDFTREVKNLPENEKIKIIESLWSIIYSNNEADIYEENLMRRLAGLLYINSSTMGDIKDRIKELKSKDYASLPDINSADYVLIFFPIEAAFNLVVSEDWEFQILSSEDRIIFTTPTNLMAVLRMAENLWRIDHQNKNAEKIAIKAGNLVDKFSGLLGDFEQLGKNIKSVEKSYEGARKKLDTGTGNIFNRIQELEDLGAKSKKTLKKSNRLQIENSEK